MILFEITNSEQHPVYQALEVSNGNRQYDFLHSIVGASIEIGRPFLSSRLIKALNFQAITCLHSNAGEYRPCPVEVGPYRPPDSYRVEPLMEDFVNSVNWVWEQSDPVVLATLVLWRLNHIHPFINGNGRTARAACYFVLCVKAGAWLPGSPILPELLRQNRAEYVKALVNADEYAKDGDLSHMKGLHELISTLLKQQLASASQEVSAPPPSDPVPG